MSDFDLFAEKFSEVGFVREFWGSVVMVEGLPGASLEEKIVFENGSLGKVVGLKENRLKVLMFDNKLTKLSEKAARTGQRIKVKVSEGLLGKIVDGLGRLIVNDNVISGEEREVERKPVGVYGRKRIGRRFSTGVMLVDLMIPLGKGQRELILGDRKTGKSLLLMQATAAHARSGGICIYAMIAKKKTEVLSLANYVKQQGLSENVVIVATTATDSAGEIYIGPYTAMTIGEYFCDQGKDVLVVMDDLTMHAKYCREIALISKKFPGRNSYPGDIFYTHSRLLERSGNFLINGKEVSITCLPAAETVQGDLSDYISTNIMSMTDGHIFFDGDLYFRGRRPAINTFLSVTRVGRQTQTKLQVDANRLLTDLMTNYEKTQGFQKFGAELGENSRQILAVGEKVLSFFDQPASVVVPEKLQVVLLALLVSGLWPGKDVENLVKKYLKVAEFKQIVDEIVDKCDTMAKLLEEVRLKSTVFVSYL